MEKETVKAILNLTIDAFLDKYFEQTPFKCEDDMFDAFDRYLAENGYTKGGDHG